ncbi:HlyD family secretion protein [Mesorhizobium xinjiangense]|uniref:HlyD family secretion protein n=1 Tax=Mesorhizobium xinjiangense TaxID=2678685 RepID=UPI0012ECFE11|nr:HlyD family secretion protein [Mesorhizobium xinjiangense]
MTRPLNLKERAARVPPSQGTDPAGKAADTAPLYHRLRRQLQGARAHSGRNAQGAAPALAAIAEMIDAEAAAVLVERDGSLAVRDLTLDARHRDSRTKLAAELRFAASEALRGPGSHQEMSTALPGAVVLASAFADGGGAVAALRRGGTPLPAARATLELAAAALQPTAREGGMGLATGLSALIDAFKGAAPADPVELAELMVSAFGASHAFIGGDDGAIRAVFPVGAVREDSPVESAARDLFTRAGSAAGPIVERKEQASTSLASALKADCVVALQVGGRRKAAPLTCLLADPAADFRQLDTKGWLVVQTLLDATLDAPQRKRARSRRRWTGRIGALVAAALALAVMFIPIPDRIRAEVELEPEGRRFVTATFNAVLLHSDAAPGDFVARGEPIAELEGEELILSHSAAAARAGEAFRRRDAAVRAKDVTEAELARLEGEAVAAERDLLAWQIAQLQLRAPVDGVVLESPFEHSDGAPLREGDVIAEIAPVDRLRVRIDVPVEDLQRLDEAVDGELHFDGVSGDPVPVTDLRRAARAETIDGQTVIPLRTTIDNPDLKLRPGQKGVALLPTGKAPIGEILFRGAWNAFRRWTL